MTSHYMRQNDISILPHIRWKDFKNVFRKFPDNAEITMCCLNLTCFSKPQINLYTSRFFKYGSNVNKSSGINHTNIQKGTFKYYKQTRT